MARTDEPLSSERSSRAGELLRETFLNEEHIDAFQEALALNDLIPDPTPAPQQESNGTTSPGLDRPGPGRRRGSMASIYGWEKVESIKSLSDFAPVHQRISRRNKAAAHQSKIGFSYHLFRWPLLGLIFLFIYLEFGLYVFLRQIVTGVEWTVASVGQRRKRKLVHKLKASKSYEEWRNTATELDYALGFQEWKETDEDPKYDYPLIRKVRKSLVHLRSAGDVTGLMGVLEICLRNNFAGVEGVRMYSETFLGTKNLIESYVNEVKRSLDYLRESPDLSLDDKRRFYRAINKNYGASALCLSGGAGFGYYHFGVVKAFLEADLLPKVVTGTSAGGIVAALVCTRTDDELRELLVPELADRITACEDSLLVWLKRVWKTGARFSPVEWAKKATFFTRGSMTFREAYERTGRALNISVVPHDQHSPTKLLNHLTAPDCVIWSAIIASAAVPGILPGVVLMQKTKAGDLRPMNFGSKFKDGSLRVDIPLESLHLLFNVNYAIVSQANPHVHLFFFAPRGSVGSPVSHRKGKGWRGGFLLSAAEQYLKLELTKNFKVIRDLELMPQLLGSDWSSVFLQRFAGSVTILPKSRILDWFRLLNDPDRKELDRMMRVGQQVAWPTLHMIENRLKVERSVLKGRAEVRHALHKAAREQTASKKRDKAKDAADQTSPYRSTSPPDGLSERSSQNRTPFIPLESDAEVGFATRSKFRRRTAQGQQQQQQSGSHEAGLGGRQGRETTEPISYADATRHSGSSGGDLGPHISSTPSSMRRRRNKTTSPDMEFGSHATGRSASWSRARQRELKELLSSRMGGAYASSVEEEEEEEGDRETTMIAGGNDGKRAGEVGSPRQRSSTFPAVLGRLPTFKLGRATDHTEETQAQPRQGEDDALGLGLGSRSGSGGGRSRLSRWLSPDPGTPPVTTSPDGPGTPRLEDGGSSNEDENELDDDMELDAEEEARGGYMLASESSTDEDEDEPIYDGGMLR